MNSHKVDVYNIYFFDEYNNIITISKHSVVDRIDSHNSNLAAAAGLSQVFLNFKLSIIGSFQEVPSFQESAREEIL
jgi:hypothetical protein